MNLNAGITVLRNHITILRYKLNERFANLLHFLANLNDTNLDLIGVNANSNAGKMKSSDESVVHDPNLLNSMLII